MPLGSEQVLIQVGVSSEKQPLQTLHNISVMRLYQFVIRTGGAPVFTLKWLSHVVRALSKLKTCVWITTGTFLGLRDVAPLERG